MVLLYNDGQIGDNGCNYGIKYICMSDNATMYRVEGGRPVEGEIRCLGTKNFATKAMIATLLGDSASELHNIPDIGDVHITLDMFRGIGVTTEVDYPARRLRIDPTTIASSVVPMPDSGTNRMPILMIAPLLHRFESVEVPVVGGCTIGVRKLDFHLEAIERFGGVVEVTESGYKATKSGRLKATEIDLPYPSVGATETCLMLSVMAEGTSVIRNIAIEPEILELMTLLRSMGAQIILEGNRVVKIQGVKRLKGSVMNILGDRIEAASWASLACATNGSIVVRGFRPDTLGNFLTYYTQIGGGFEILGESDVRFYRDSANLKPINIETDVWPGFSTDWQQPFAVVLTQAEGVSVVHETVYENRFGYLKTLVELGAKVELSTECLGELPCRFKGEGHPHSAIITGATALSSGSTIEVPDLRAGLAYFIAAQLADGTTTIQGIDKIERGYGDLTRRLKDTNIVIERV